MRVLILAALAATTAAVTVTATPAPARDGCGRGFHAGPRGRCLPNRIGQYYRGQGYWYQGRYWQHRYRDRNFRGGWRYR